MEASGNLSFGQISQLREFESLSPDFRHGCNRHLLVALPPGTSPAAAHRALKVLERRHASLRTVYDLSDSTNPKQIIVDPGTLGCVGELDSMLWEGTLTDCEHAVQEVAHEPYDLQAMGAWRFRIIARQGSATHVLFLFHHIAADGWSISTLVDELRAAVTDPLTPRLDGVAYSPVDLAGEQQVSVDGKRLETLRYWASVLAHEKSQRLDVPFTGRRAVAVQGTLRSRSMRTASLAIAERLQVPVSTVLLAAYATAITKVLGGADFSLRVASSNRFEPHWRDCVTALSQWVPVLLDLRRRATFEETVSAVLDGILTAYTHGMFNPDEIAQACGVPVEQATGMGVQWGYNYLPASFAKLMTPAGSVAEDSLEWEENRPTVYRSRYLKAIDDGNELLLQLTAGDLIKSTVEELLRGIQNVLLAESVRVSA